MKPSPLLVAALLGVAQTAPERVTCPVTADAHVYATPCNPVTPEE